MKEVNLKMQAHEIRALGVMIAGLRDAGDDVVIVSVEAHGPDHDMHEGCVGATVRFNGEEGHARSKYLDAAISLARGDAKRKIAAREKKAAKA